MFSSHQLQDHTSANIDSPVDVMHGPSASPSFVSPCLGGDRGDDGCNRLIPTLGPNPNLLCICWTLLTRNSSSKEDIPNEWANQADVPPEDGVLPRDNDHLKV